MTDAAALIDQIERAFSDVPYPGDDDLAIDSYGDEPEAVARAFRGHRDWRALGAAFLDDAPEGWGTALSFFSDRAYRFYLPAYLIAHVHGHEFRTDPGVSLSFGVTPQDEGRKLAQMWGGGTLGDHARRRFEPFDAYQVQAIVAYLWWRLDQYGEEDGSVAQALEHYWLEREAKLDP